MRPNLRPLSDAVCASALLVCLSLPAASQSGSGTGHCPAPQPQAAERRSIPWDRHPACNCGKLTGDETCPTFPAAFWLQLFLQQFDPEAVTEPFEFSAPLALVSERGYSWTAMRFTWQGLNITDAYQPGRPETPIATTGIAETDIASGMAEPQAYGAAISVSQNVPEPAWHGQAETAATGQSLAGDNFPSPGKRGLLRQTEQYRHYIHSRIDAGGPLSPKVDAGFAAAGEWSSITIPLASGAQRDTRTLFGSAAVRAQLTPRDQLQFRATASSTHLPDWGSPAGLEALAGRRMSPSFTLPSLTGFQGLKEDDSFRALQTIWHRPVGRGTFEARGGLQWAALNTVLAIPAGAQSLVDMLGGVLNAVAPLANDAARNRQAAGAAYRVETNRHSLAASAEWERSGIRNRFRAPSNLNLITAGGTPASVVLLNTPSDSRQSFRTSSASLRDGITVPLGGNLRLEFGAALDHAAGGSISWTTVSPTAGLAFTPACFNRITIRGSYARLYAPLSGRTLDAGDAQALGGRQFQWLDDNGDRQFQPAEAGPLLSVFGGPYSSIDTHFERPYADEIRAGAAISLPFNAFASASFFRRDEKRRMALVNTGLAGEFDPTTVFDPGGDGIPGTGDDQRVIAYAQRASSLGADRYLLTNPQGLRNLNEGAVLETGLSRARYSARASFMAMKSFGPSNPGNAPIENDPGILGALYADPNTLVNATGRHFFDRAYVGKAQFTARLPKALGGLECSSVVNYMDGVVFGRRLLVTGMPQGPFLLNATVRGSPEGGHRAEYVLNWNMRVSRGFKLPKGSLAIATDLINVTNNGNRIQEVEASGPQFNQRLPIAIPPARFARISVRYGF
jgi:hypothetical protein